jgi:hypothetical protein
MGKQLKNINKNIGNNVDKKEDIINMHKVKYWLEKTIRI